MMRRYLTLSASLLAAVPAILCGQKPAPKCDADNAGLKLPAGFCAIVFADSLRGARHIWVSPQGDVFVSSQDGTNGGIWGLRDSNGDGKADVKTKFAGGFRSSEVAFFDGYLYAENITGVLRFPYKAGSLEAAGKPDTIVEGLPTGGHFNKTFTIDKGGALYVNIGSPSNSCQEKDRGKEVPGKNPCPELEQRAGIWKWDARKLHQTYANSTHFATGIRNAVGITLHPQTNRLWATQHGRDQLGGEESGGSWPNSAHYNAENPAEELLQVNQSDDFGWPYCYFSVEEKHLVLAPEYGGDGKKQGDCAKKKEPVATFPAHWAPNGLMFYTGSMFPARYKNGAFIAFHGSWNRAPEEQAGFNVVFQPLNGDKAAGAYEVFADGFALNRVGRGGGNHRPTGLGQGPDGSLYVADDALGRIYKIVFSGM
jgi:glucose/arabinose dehydrogenase